MEVYVALDEQNLLDSQFIGFLGKFPADQREYAVILPGDVFSERKIRLGLFLAGDDFAGDLRAGFALLTRDAFRDLLAFFHGAVGAYGFPVYVFAVVLDGREFLLESVVEDEMLRMFRYRRLALRDGNVAEYVVFGIRLEYQFGQLVPQYAEADAEPRQNFRRIFGGERRAVADGRIQRRGNEHSVLAGRKLDVSVVFPGVSREGYAVAVAVFPG